MQGAPDARGGVANFLLALLAGDGVAEQLVELAQLRLAVVAAVGAQAADLGVGHVLVRVVDVAGDVLALLQLLLELGQGLVAVRAHDGELGDQDEDGNGEVAEEEALRDEGAVRGGVGEAVQQEDGGGGVEGAGHGGHDGAGEFGEGIGDLERGYEDEGAAQRQKDIAEDVAIEVGNRKGISHEQTPGHEAQAADDTGNTRPEAIQDRADGEGRDVAGGGGDGEEKVQSGVAVSRRTGKVEDVRPIRGGRHPREIPEILFVAQFDIAQQFVFCAQLAVDTLVDEDRLERGETKHDAGRQPARNHGDQDLNCDLSQRAGSDGSWSDAMRSERRDARVRTETLRRGDLVRRDSAGRVRGVRGLLGWRESIVADDPPHCLDHALVCFAVYAVDGCDALNQRHRGRRERARAPVEGSPPEFGCHGKRRLKGEF